MHKWISVLLAGVMCVLMVGCTKTTTATVYQHEYIRTIPTAVVVVGVAAACYCTGGAAAPYIVSLFGMGVAYAK